MDIAEQLDFGEMRMMVTEGFISHKKHPTLDLWIWNYTAKAAYTFKPEEWTESLSWCRGLITDAHDDVVAIPFKKFWNIEQHPELPAEPFDVYDKIDGSLGIIVKHQDQVVTATRGSFVSEQAIRAREFLDRLYPRFPIDVGVTYLCEVVYPQNQIVVSYNTEQLVLLAVIANQTGIEQPLDLYQGGMPIVHSYPDIEDPLTVLQANPRENAEGFVIRFRSGLRVKAKYASYVRLHRIVTGVSNKAIWEMLKEGQTYDNLLDNVPADFERWFHNTVAELKAAYRSIEGQCIDDFKTVPQDKSRKAAADVITECQYPGVLFRMLDGREYADLIYKLIKPKWERPFKTDEP